MADNNIRSIDKTVDTLLMEFDQQAFKVYISSGSDSSAVSRTRSTLMTGSPMLSPVHAANLNSAKQSHEANKCPCRAFPQVVGVHSLPVKRNCNAEQRQRRRKRR